MLLPDSTWRVLTVYFHLVYIPKGGTSQRSWGLGNTPRVSLLYSQGCKRDVLRCNTDLISAFNTVAGCCWGEHSSLKSLQQVLLARSYGLQNSIFEDGSLVHGTWFRYHLVLLSVGQVDKRCVARFKALIVRLGSKPTKEMLLVSKGIAICNWSEKLRSTLTTILQK